jgi:lysophospholipase L1-like esterase
MILRRVVAAFALSLCAFVSSQAAQHAAEPTWVAAWYSPPFPPTANLIYNDVRVVSHQTVRQVLRLEAAGDRLRIRLTNELGLLPTVKFGAIHIALSSPNGVTDAKTDHQVLFAGKPDGEIKLGEALVSDPVDFKVSAQQLVAVSVYYPARLAPSGHLVPLRFSKPGDHSAEAVMPFVDINRAPSIVSGVEVEAPGPRNVLVAFGDSITEGAGATPGWNLSWPQQLSLRLAKARQGKNWIVINSGIGGNRLLYDGAGPKASDRFDRDVLNIAGLKSIILLEGINDIGAGSTIDTDTGPRSADDIIGAYKHLINRAHARQIKIYGGTLIPYSGAAYFSVQGEAVRQAVNAWIRTSDAFDGVIDFDAVMRDPSVSGQLVGAYQSGDNLHPNDAGYAAMANAVDLNMITGASQKSHR